MKSKAGNKLKKIRKLAILATTLTGCIFSPEPKTPKTHEIDPACFQQDSTTWADTMDVDHLSCHIGDSLPNIMPPILRSSP